LIAQVPAGRFRVNYEDGTDDECRIRPSAIVEAERKWPGRKDDNSDVYPMVEGMHFIIWVSLRRPGKNFDAWLDTVVDVESVDDETAHPSPPTVGED
jgi:hypothetical protein